jgi:preprotein translocase subunit SecE
MAAFNPVQFLNESYLELKKSTWLTRPQAVGSTIVVLVIVSLVALYISLVDYTLSFLMKLLLGG